MSTLSTFAIAWDEAERRGKNSTSQTCDLVSGQWLIRVLTAGGRADLVYGFATTREYPSWGDMVAKDATTVWELWNGDTADPAMNSGNHVMLVGRVTESAKPVAQVPGVKFVRQEPGHLVLEVVAGTYRFAVKP